MRVRRGWCRLLDTLIGRTVVAATGAPLPDHSHVLRLPVLRTRGRRGLHPPSLRFAPPTRARGLVRQGVDALAAAHLPPRDSGGRGSVREADTGRGAGGGRV